MTQRLIACAFCKHYRGADEAGTPVCDAFPQGIPQLVRLGRLTHRMPIVGDHGILWEPTDGFEHVLDHIDAKDEPLPKGQYESE